MRLEIVDVHCIPSMPSAAIGIASAEPVSSRLFRLGEIAGQPPEMLRKVTPRSSSSSCVTVSLTILPRGSRSKVTREVRSRWASGEQESQE